MTRNLFEVIKARLSILGISSQQNIESGKYQALVFSEKGKGNLERINDTKKKNNYYEILDANLKVLEI